MNYEEPSIGGARVSFWSALTIVLIGLLGWYSDDTPRWPGPDEELPYHCGTPELSDSPECHR